MRVALGRISHEANTLCPRATDWADFENGWIRRGAEVLEELEGKNIEESGAMHTLGVSEEPGCEVIPLLGAKAGSGGPVVGQVFYALLNELVGRLKTALPVDGVLLILHGAMMAQDEPDATGEILRAVRAVVGQSVPIVATLDLHANVTARMVRNATALVGYHTAPHIDMYHTGETAARLLLGTVRGELSPAMTRVRLPMIIPSENARHTDGPLSEVINMALAMEKEGVILHAGIYPVQPWLDVEDTGCAVVVVTDRDPAAAREHAQALALAFWERRGAFIPKLVPPDEAIRRALGREAGTVVFCDSADSPSSGATGDSTVILQAMLRAAPMREVALLNVVDPGAVSQAIEAGVGTEVTVEVGGALAPSFYAPTTYSGYVKTISDGTFRFKGPGMRGLTFHMGRAAVLIQGGIHLVVMERPVTQWDPELYRSLGEEPTDARIVQVKSPAAFRAAYEGIADQIIIIQSPGVSSPDLSSLPWRRLPRPIYPLDPNVAFP